MGDLLDQESIVMKGYRQALVFATAILILPVFAYSQNASAPDSQSMSQSAQTPNGGSHEAATMKPARALLIKTVNARQEQSGQVVDAKLDSKVKLSNGTELPKGTILLGKVTTDDMQLPGVSKLALRFDEAQLKDGTNVPIRATIVGFYGPGAEESVLGTANASDQVPNDWNAKTLQLDQENVVSGVDLHSKISSQNSGVFVSTKKDNVKLKAGSEIQFAIAPVAANTTQNAGQ
jgi:hypothetical protein